MSNFIQELVSEYITPHLPWTDEPDLLTKEVVSGSDTSNGGTYSRHDNPRAPTTSSETVRTGIFRDMAAFGLSGLLAMAFMDRETVQAERAQLAPLENRILVAHGFRGSIRDLREVRAIDLNTRQAERMQTVIELVQARAHELHGNEDVTEADVENIDLGNRLTMDQFRAVLRRARIQQRQPGFAEYQQQLRDQQVVHDRLVEIRSELTAPHSEEESEELRTEESEQRTRSHEFRDTVQATRVRLRAEYPRIYSPAAQASDRVIESFLNRFGSQMTAEEFRLITTLEEGDGIETSPAARLGEIVQFNVDQNRIATGQEAGLPSQLDLRGLTPEQIRTAIHHVEAHQSLPGYGDYYERSQEYADAFWRLMNAEVEARQSPGGHEAFYDSAEEPGSASWRLLTAERVTYSQMDSNGNALRDARNDSNERFIDLEAEEARIFSLAAIEELAPPDTMEEGRASLYLEASELGNISFEDIDEDVVRRQVRELLPRQMRSAHYDAQYVEPVAQQVMAGLRRITPMQLREQFRRETTHRLIRGSAPLPAVAEVTGRYLEAQRVESRHSGGIRGEVRSRAETERNRILDTVAEGLTEARHIAERR